MLSLLLFDDFPLEFYITSTYHFSAVKSIEQKTKCCSVCILMEWNMGQSVRKCWFGAGGLGKGEPAGKGWRYARKHGAVLSAERNE